MVQVSYSQRYLKGKKPLPIESEVEAFVKSLNFTPFSSFGLRTRCPPTRVSHGARGRRGSISLR